MGLCGSAEADEQQRPERTTQKAPTSASAKPVDPATEEIAANLKLIPLLRKLSSDELLQLAGAMNQRHFDQDEALMREGDEGDSFYILKSGTCAVMKFNTETQQNNQVAELKPKDYCGEAALLNNSKRGATIISNSASGTDVYTLDRAAFQQLFGNSSKKLNITFAKRTAISAETTAAGTTSPGGKRESGGASSSPARMSNSMPAGAKVQKSPEEIAAISAAITDNILFQNLSPKQREVIIASMWLKPVEAGENIIKQGDLGDNFYVVNDGTFDIFVAKGQAAEVKVASRKAGSSFGELALMYNAPRAATVRAVEPSHVWCVDRWTFRRVVTSAQNAKLHEYEDFLRGVQSFEVLLENERSRIAEALEEVTFPRGHVIVKQGDPGDTLFIVKAGEVVVTQTKNGQEVELTRYHPGNFFGERALLKEEPRAATCTAVRDVVCLYLNREAFSLLLGSMEEIFQDRIQGYNSAGGADAASSKKPETKYVSASVSPAQASGSANAGGENHLDRNMKLADLSVIGTLGKGSFGHVQLVKHKSTGKTYALKTVGKQQVVQLGQQSHIISEKSVMAQLNHPFLIRLHATFQDRDCLYFVLEPSLGGELFSVLRNKTNFDENTARFYAAGVILAFEYMHSHGIIYRDLKPENLLLDDKGYLKVTDFGFAKKVHDGRTWTLCGTPDYLAPEVVSGAGHGKGVDWWTLGVLIYEMIASYPPFYDEEPMKTYAKIMHASPAWPMHFSRSAIDLLKGLLHAKPTKRLGVTNGGAAAIKKHAWFNGFDWASFEKKQMKAPIILPIKSLEDLSNFEVYEDDDMAIPPYTGDPKTPGWDKDF